MKSRETGDNNIRNIHAGHKQALWALALTVICFAFTFLTRRVIFSTNDDTRIMYALAGYCTGEPFPYQDFINITVGWVISFLYRIIPSLPWYGICHISYLAVSLFVFFYCLFSIGNRQGIHPLISAFLCVAYYVIVILFVLSGLQFSTTAAAMGMAGTVLIFSIDFQNDSKKSVYVRMLLSVLFMCLSYALRSYSAYISICFYVLTLAYQFVKYNKAKKDKRVTTGRVGWIMVLAVLMIAILIPSMRFISHSMREKASDPRDLPEYDSARVLVQDYRMFPSYEGNEDFYKNIGWDENIYSAFLGLQFMDESMNTEAFRAMYDEYTRQAKGRFGFLGGSIRNLKQKIREILRYRVAKGLIVLSAGMFIGGVIFWINNRQKMEEGLFLLFSTFGGAALVMLFAYMGRLPIRMFVAVMMLTCSVQALSVIRLSYINGNNSTVASDTKISKIVWITAVCIFCISLCGISAYNWRAVYLKDEGSRTQTRTTATLDGFEAFERYAISNPDNIYVYDFTVGTVARDPFIVYGDMKPTNCIISGGSYTYSTPYFKQLELLGLERLNFETLLDEGVFYVTNATDYCDKVCQILENKTGKRIHYSVVESFADNTVMVVRFEIA